MSRIASLTAATTLPKMIDAAIHLLISKDGDRDHMNHSTITCEQSMAIVDILRTSKGTLEASRIGLEFIADAIENQDMSHLDKIKVYQVAQSALKALALSAREIERDNRSFCPGGYWIGSAVCKTCKCSESPTND